MYVYAPSQVRELYAIFQGEREREREGIVYIRVSAISIYVCMGRGGEGRGETRGYGVPIYICTVLVWYVYDNI